FSLIALFITLDAAVYMINFGALVAFALVNLGVIKYFFFEKGVRGSRGWIQYLILPLIGFGFTAWLWTSLAPFTYVLGAAWLAVGVLIYGSRTNWFRADPPSLQFDENEPITRAVPVGEDR
ncbi:Putrescine importer PuuP, partial [Leucobacter sp. M11]|nr:Putrescine importer PuuP [Leucobacter sp. M11]